MQQSIKVSMRWLGLLLTTIILSACGNNEAKDLQKYVAKVKATPSTEIEPAPSFKTYQKFTYPEKEQRDPFREQKRPTKVANNSKVLPDLTRPKQALETYPLDSLRMVGILRQEQKNWAIVGTPDGKILRVTTGGYIGQNFGRVESIDPDEVSIVETVPDGEGWRYREASLVLVKDES